MPATSWVEIAGELCARCARPASHYYAGIPICCQCHGGNICTKEETADKNELAVWRLRLAKELMGWHKTFLKHDLIVDDDGCMWGDKCRECGALYEHPHKEDCPHLNYGAIWQTSDEVYDDGDPKHYQYVNTWNPLGNSAHTLNILRGIMEKWNYSWAVFGNPAPTYTAEAFDEMGNMVAGATNVQPRIAVCHLAIKLLNKNNEN